MNVFPIKMQHYLSLTLLKFLKLQDDQTHSIFHIERTKVCADPTKVKAING